MDTELIKKLSGNYHTELKTVNIPPNSWTTMNSAVLKDGIYDVKANVSYSVSNDSAATILAIETAPYTDTVSVRGNMGGGGGLYVSKLIDARNKDVTVSAKAFHSNVSASEATSLFSYIRLC